MLRDRLPWVTRAIEKHGNFGLFVVVSEEAEGTLPDGAFRAESKAQAKRFEDEVLFTATVIEGTRLLHSLTRTMLRGLAMVVGPKVESRFFDDVRTAVAWLVKLAAPYEGPSSMAVLDTLFELRELQRATG